MAKSAVSLGMAFSSAAHSPKSMSWQRLLQKGEIDFSVSKVQAFWHVGRGLQKFHQTFFFLDSP